MREARAWVDWARLIRGPAHPRLLAPRRIARLQLEAQAQELRQAEAQAQRVQEEQAWVQLKEQEVLKLQVGRGRGECGHWRLQQGRLWGEQHRVSSDQSLQTMVNERLQASYCHVKLEFRETISENGTFKREC